MKQNRHSFFRALPALGLLGGLLWLACRAPLALPVNKPDLPAADELPEAMLQQTEEAVIFESDLPPVSAAPAEEAALAVSTAQYQSTGTVYYKNQTDYEIDLPAMLQKPSPVRLGSDGVQVLIMHTHGTEAYTPSPGHEYTPSGDYRTLDSACNMLSVGEKICDCLNQRGISAVHSTTLNDYPAYNGAYTRALADINAWIEQYPSVTLVIDVHRDAIGTAGNYVKTAAQVNGRQTAQLMFVTGTDQGGRNHPNWRDNLTFQAQIHDRLNSVYPGIMRPISIRTGRFNQHIRKGSMLVEVGACGNTLEEALAAAELFANALADALLE